MEDPRNTYLVFPQSLLITVTCSPPNHFHLPTPLKYDLLLKLDLNDFQHSRLMIWFHIKKMLKKDYMYGAGCLHFLIWLERCNSHLVSYKFRNFFGKSPDRVESSSISLRPWPIDLYLQQLLTDSLKNQLEITCTAGPGYFLDEVEILGLFCTTHLPARVDLGLP